jgi:hypothetical protein
MAIFKTRHALFEYLISSLALARGNILLLLNMEKHTTVHIAPSTSQCGDLRDEYEQCKKEDMSKYALIEVLTPFALSIHADVGGPETPGQTRRVKYQVGWKGEGARERERPGNSVL